MKKVIIALAVAAAVLAGSTAFALTDMQGNSVITVTLTIQAYTQIWFQDDAFGIAAAAGEPDIVFSSLPNVDYYRALPQGLIGIYASGPTVNATDASAIGYFESFDGATIWMQSNQNLLGTFNISGDLKNGAATIPTWFTVAVNGYDASIPGSDPNGFRLGNSASGLGWVNDGTLPGDGKGGYGGNNVAGGQSVAGGPIYFGAQSFWPNQDCFRMSTMNGATLPMTAPIGPGTMKFLARCQRAGMADPAGNYTAIIQPTFVVVP